jgi:preprotein translocase subunit YajC
LCGAFDAGTLCEIQDREFMAQPLISCALGRPGALTISIQPKIQMPTIFIFQQGGGNFLIAILPWILIFGVFYFLLIVPQRKRQRALQETIENLKAGDKVITNGGIVGTITAVRDTTFLIRSGEKSILEISRAAISGLAAEDEEKK